MADDIVYFLTPDGQKVSNDPRFKQPKPKTMEDAGSLNDKPYKDWSGDQLKAEISRRNEGRMGDEILKLQKGMKKKDVVALLEADDQRGGAAPGTPIGGQDDTTPEGDDEE